MTSKAVAKRHLASIAVVGLFSALAAGSVDPGSTGSRGASSGTVTPSPEAQAAELLSFDYKWRKTGGGSIMELDFKITNKGTSTVKDVEITCVHFAPSGTQIDSNTRTIYEQFPPGKTISKREFNMGFIHSQASQTNCRITDLAF